MATKPVQHQLRCFHCGEDCRGSAIYSDGKVFCCDGCVTVYGILNKAGMCDYYTISRNPGLNQRKIAAEGKFSFLSEEKIIRQLASYRDKHHTHISFYLPQIHCSSCLWLLENLHRINPQVISSKVNFEKKEVDIVFDHTKLSACELAELLTAVGYEPYISLSDIGNRKPSVSRSKIYKLGIAGFCFANIMLLSFPEYLGIDQQEQYLISAFRYISLLLALPAFFYAGSEFYVSAWKSLRHGFLNIDAPIVLSVCITFSRSCYEIITNTGSGYLDSMSGIIFFMLVGRVLQDRTYAALSFERDYTSYFPVAVTKTENGKESNITLGDIKLDDTLLIHSQELIPADGILTKGTAIIDYSFVTGESYPVKKEMGELIYAGGKHIGSNIELMVIKEVAQSYLTKLWDKQSFKTGKPKNQTSFVHALSRYFTWVVLCIALGSVCYWYRVDASKAWNAVTAVLIIACPCGLLLSNTFTNGNILRMLARNQFYLRSAETIETIAAVDHIVFDKTGTLTTGGFDNIQYEGKRLGKELRQKVAMLANQSTHPLCKSIAACSDTHAHMTIAGFEELPGEGIEGIVGDDLIMLGSAQYVTGKKNESDSSTVYVAVEGKVMGRFVFTNQYRDQLPMLLKKLRKRFSLAVLSGDTAGERERLQKLTGHAATLLFQQGPSDKLNAIKSMQGDDHVVMMIGDGLNDAGALRQANVGISVVESYNNFTPASDAILNAGKLTQLHLFIQMCRFNKKTVAVAFGISAIYNIIGLSYAIQGTLQPVIAAILMPCSSISILAITFGMTNAKGRLLGL